MDKESSVIVPEKFSRPEERSIVPESTSLLATIARVASSPQMNMDTVERLYAMHREERGWQAQQAFNEAMARAQKKIQPVIAKSMNEHTRSSYAKLEAIDRVITPIHTEEGLSVSYDTETANKDDPIPEGYKRIVMWIYHSGGHKERRHIDLPPDDVGAKGTTNKTMVQAIGSTNTYGRRYLKLMAFNVSTFDDKDGNAPKPEVEPDPEGKKALEACGSMAALQEAWKALTAKQRATLNDVKNMMKAQIEEAEKEAAK